MRRTSLFLSLLASLLMTLVVTAPGAQAGDAVPSSPPTTMAAVGDSITRAYDATLFGCFLADCPANSWATGSNATVGSQYTRLRALSPTLAATNVAKTGVKMSDFQRQLNLVASTTSVQYVTVLLGANDVCTSSLSTMTDPTVFKSQFQTALDGFLVTHQNAYVFVSSIPNVRQLYDLFKSSSSAQSTWRTFRICQSMLSSSIDDMTRAQVQAVEITYNQALADVCTAQPRCRWDNNATYKYVFQKPEVSTVDYFHPSVAGQKKLAEITWAASYWAPPTP